MSNVQRPCDDDRPMATLRPRFSLCPRCARRADVLRRTASPYARLQHAAQDDNRAAQDMGKFAICEFVA